MDNLQEKFQITAPPNKNDDSSADGDSWVTPNSVHIHPGDFSTHVLNQIPTVNLDSPVMRYNGGMPLVGAGTSDVTDKVGGDDLKAGFVPRTMEGTDDQYTGEHVDLFYGEAVGTDDAGRRVVGFVERNNYLDRA